MLSLFIYKYLLNDSYFKNIDHSKYLTKNKKIREFFSIFFKNNGKNNTIDKLYFIKECELSKDLPNPKDFLDFPIHKSCLKLKDRKTEELVGSINGMPWFWGDRPIFLVDDLWVDTLYRKKGLGEYLIMNLASRLLPLNGLGIFTTHRLLNSIKDEHILSIVFWYKPKQIKEKCAIADEYKEITSSELNIPNYIFDQSLFNVDEEYIKKYVDLFCKKGKIYVSGETVLGIYHKEDIDSDYNQLAWYWGTLEEKFDEKYNCMIPNLKERYDETAWDRACTYIYGKLNENDMIVLRDEDIYGWFLPR